MNNDLGNFETKVYCAGRIESRAKQTKKGYRWGLVNTILLDDSRLAKAPLTRFSIGKIPFIYTGPYTLADDHRGSHLPHLFDDKNKENLGYGTRSHGSALYIDSFNTKESNINARHTFLRALDGIKQCDVLFVWIDDMEAYGTLIEIGFAKALGKHIVLATPPLEKTTANDPANPFGELWFAFKSANELVHGDNANACFESWALRNALRYQKGQANEHR
jgi:hypothetical protein